MSTKELHVLKFWHRALIEIFKKAGYVSAGQVGKHVGQSRTTAKKYLDKLVAEKVVESFQTSWKNGVMATVYGPIKDAAK